MQSNPLAEKLRSILGQAKVLGSRVACAAYGRDMSIFSAIPEAVALPTSVDEVHRVMEFALSEKIPVTPRGAGTSVTGAVIPIKGGIVLDLSGMKTIKEINFIDRYAVVEPGVICAQLNAALAPGFFFPPDPGSLDIATIGGMISTNASGRSALKYGTTADYVMALEVVLGSGEIIRPGHRTPKASAGFDLTRLFSAAEGTLGVITEATLRILPRPEALAVCLAGFSSMEEAAETAVELISSGLPLCACELLDGVSLKKLHHGLEMDFRDIGGMLIMEIDGPATLVSEKMSDLQQACERCGALMVHSFSEKAQQEKIWHLRNNLISSLGSYRRNSRLIPLAEDMGVPVSKVPEAIRRSSALAAAHDVPVVLFGHAGDGNIHTTFVLNPRDRDGWSRAKSLAADLHSLAMEMGGTISAEHGIGLAKAPFIGQELGESHVVMRKIKRLLDPHDLMNPGKLGFSEVSDKEVGHFVFEVLLEGPKRLATLGNQRADQDALLCMMCGSCRAHCPVFAVTGRESDNARGKVQLAYLIRTGQIPLSPELAQQFYHCTGCAACEQNCPAGIAVNRLVAAVKGQIGKSGFLPPAIEMANANIRQQGNPLGRPPQERFSLSLLYPEGRRRNFPARAPVLVFMGCAVSYLDPQMLGSMLHLLDATGVAYTLLREREICCGLPLAQAGDEEAFRLNAAGLAALIREAKPQLILTPCPACLKALGSLYPSVVAGWDIEVKSLVEYLHEIIGSSGLQFTRTLEKRVSYHDPCLLARCRGIIDQPRHLLSRVPGISLVEFPKSKRSAWCCGGGNGLPGVAPEIAGQMASWRISQAMELGSQVIATACPTCKHQLLKGLEKFGREKLQVLDISEILHMALGPD